MTSTLLQFARERLDRSDSKTWTRALEIVQANWHYGFTAFGGPPVHFQIFHKDFVEKRKWIDEQTYQEIFAVSQATPGPGSTKMLYCINTIRGGVPAGCLAFIIWSLPGALGMFGLAVGISRINEKLPPPVYALLSGLNAATVGIIALAAVQLSHNAITDRFTRALVFLGGAVGILHTALWYFPMLMAAGGAMTVLWDYRIPHAIGNKVKLVLRRSPANPTREVDLEHHHSGDGSLATDVQPHKQLTRLSIEQEASANVSGNDHSSVKLASKPVADQQQSVQTKTQPPLESEPTKDTSFEKRKLIPLVIFAISFIVVMVLRGVLKSAPKAYSLFSNLYLAGTIIFGGGPVVIPLLREYVVSEGWVSSRDFLLGLAIIQAFPGPNFNFAVYLGALTLASSTSMSLAGAVIAFIGIFSPGILVVAACLNIWSKLRTKRWLRSLLRGINAAAIGLVFTAVYRLWQIGLVDGKHEGGSSLANDPWWVTVTATSFVGCAWFGLNAPFAIVIGATLGMIWYAVDKA